MNNVVQLASTKPEQGGFFAVDRRVWPQVIALGLNPSVAYLVLARGTGGDNRTTSWSTNAIETYTGIGRPRAIRAIDRLLAAGLVTRLRGGSRPQYYIEPDAEPEADWIWLPNALIDGAAKEAPPVERVRQSHNLGALRLLVELYGAHDLSGEGGIPWRSPVGVREDYARTELGKWGRYVIWGFKREREWPDSFSLWRASPLVQPHLLKSGPVEDMTKPFWAALNVLTLGGLVQFIPHLVDADTPDGEILHPLAVAADGALPNEETLRMAAVRAAVNMLPPQRIHMMEDGEWSIAVPVDAMLSAVQVIGIGRLRYRPKTSATAAWLSRSDEWDGWAERYDDILQTVLDPKKMQHQGEIKG